MMRFRFATVALVAIALSACGAVEPASVGISATDASSLPTTPTVESHALDVFTHCGWYEVVIDGVIWTPINGVRGSMPEGTDAMSTPGRFTTDGAGRAVFTAESGLVVEFVPASAELAPVHPCD